MMELKTKLLDIKHLSKWFGGFATVKYNKQRAEYTLIIKNDDLINEFVFTFSENEFTQFGETYITVELLQKYLTQMQMEQRIKLKGLQKWTK